MLNFNMCCRSYGNDTSENQSKIDMVFSRTCKEML